MVRTSGIALLAAVSLVVLALQDCLDPAVHAITLGDETVYLKNGLEFAWRDLGNYEAFPLHSLGYRLLGVLIADPVDLYKVGAAVGFGALILLATLVLYEYSGLALAAFLLGFALVADPLVGLEVAPYPQRTALVVVLAGAWIARRISDPLRSAVPLGLAFFVACFARAEYVLSFYAVSLGILAHVLVRRSRAGLRTAALYAALVAGLSLLSEFPLLGGSDRSLMAFGQHYALQKQEQGLNIDPWIQWSEVLQRDFGGAASVQGALLANPRAFLGHLSWSGRELFGWARELHPLTALALLACLAATALELVRRVRARPAADPAGLVLFALLLAGAAPVAASALVIAPREHYMQQLYVWVALLGAHSARSLLPARLWEHAWVQSRTALIALAAVFAALVPNAAAEPDLVAVNSRIVRELVIAPGRELPRVFSMFLKFSVYIDLGCEELFFSRWLPRQQGLREFLESERVDLVLLNTERIPQQPPEVRAGLEAFLADPGAHGFEPLHTDERLHAFARTRP